MLLPFPETDVELERSYQIKHKKIDKEVDSQVDFKNSKSTVKKRMPNIDVNSVEKKVNNERTEKTLSGKKRVLIVGESVMKHLNGYEICKFFAGSKFTDS